MKTVKQILASAKPTITKILAEAGELPPMEELPPMDAPMDEMGPMEDEAELSLEDAVGQIVDHIAGVAGAHGFEVDEIMSALQSHFDSLKEQEEEAAEESDSEETEEETADEE